MGHFCNGGQPQWCTLWDGRPECIKPAPVNDNHSPGPSQSFLTPNQKKSLTDVDFLLSLSSSVKVKACNVTPSISSLQCQYQTSTSECPVQIQITNKLTIQQAADFTRWLHKIFSYNLNLKSARWVHYLRPDHKGIHRPLHPFFRFFEDDVQSLAGGLRNDSVCHVHCAGNVHRGDLRYNYNSILFHFILFWY